MPCTTQRNSLASGPLSVFLEDIALFLHFFPTLLLLLFLGITNSAQRLSRSSLTLGWRSTSNSIRLMILGVLVKAELNAGTRKQFKKCFGLRGHRFLAFGWLIWGRKGGYKWFQGFWFRLAVGNIISWGKLQINVNSVFYLSCTGPFVAWMSCTCTLSFLHIPAVTSPLLCCPSAVHTFLSW